MRFTEGQLCDNNPPLHSSSWAYQMKHLSPHTYWVLCQQQGFYSHGWTKTHHCGFCSRFVLDFSLKLCLKDVKKTWLEVGNINIFCSYGSKWCASIRCFFKTSFMMLTPLGLLRVGDIVLLLAPVSLRKNSLIEILISTEWQEFPVWCLIAPVHVLWFLGI